MKKNRSTLVRESSKAGRGPPHPKPVKDKGLTVATGALSAEELPFAEDQFDSLAPASFREETVVLLKEPKASNKKNPMYLCNLNKQALVKVLHPHHNPRSSTVCPTRTSRTTSSLRNKFKPWWILSRNTPAFTIRGTESIRTTAQNWTCGSSVQACSPALPTYSAASTLNRRGRPSAK